jgi:hypothetical protein
LALIKQKRQDDNLEGFLEDLQPLANAIATSKKPLITVPTEIVQTAHAALSARKEHHQFHVRETDDADSEKIRANDQHWHFIKKLEEALETLEPRFAASTRTGPGRATSASSPSTSEALENQFATLPIEHPTESESTGPATASQTPLPSENHTFHEIEGAKEEEEIEQEKGFAIFCLFKDLKRLQNYISGIWVRYKKQEINLITASAITNAAFQLAIRIQDETLEAFPNCSSYKDAVSAILPHSSQVVKEREEADGSEDGANLAELPFALAHDILDKFCKNIGPSHASLRLQQNTHQLLHYCIALVSPRRSWADRILLTKLLWVIEKQYPHLTSTGEPASDELAADEPATDGLDTDKLVSDESAKDKLSTDGLATDELTRGLRKMLSTKDIPVWLAFATTVFFGHPPYTRNGSPVESKHHASCCHACSRDIGSVLACLFA